jgi:hypothetical protein
MGYSGFKGIGPNKIGANKGAGISSPAKQIASDMKKPDMIDKSMSGTKPSPKPKPKPKPSPAKQTASQKKNLPKQIVDAIAAKSPAKKNKGMSYDIKEASNQKLSASARKHYAENAQAANKSGYKG